MTNASSLELSWYKDYSLKKNLTGAEEELKSTCLTGSS